MSSDEWLPVGIVVEGQRLTVAGVSVWDSARWRSEHRRVALLHGGERHRVSVYRMADAEPPVRLALGEVSAGVCAVGVSPPSTVIER
jgi:hypothetical protein